MPFAGSPPTDACLAADQEHTHLGCGPCLGPVATTPPPHHTIGPLCRSRCNRLRAVGEGACAQCAPGPHAPPAHALVTLLACLCHCQAPPLPLPLLALALALLLLALLALFPLPALLALPLPLLALLTLLSLLALYLLEFALLTLVALIVFHRLLIRCQYCRLFLRSCLSRRGLRSLLRLPFVLLVFALLLLILCRLLIECRLRQHLALVGRGLLHLMLRCRGCLLVELLADGRAGRAQSDVKIPGEKILVILGEHLNPGARIVDVRVLRGRGR